MSSAVPSILSSPLYALRTFSQWKLSQVSSPPSEPSLSALRAHFASIQESKDQAAFFNNLLNYSNDSKLPYPGLLRPELVSFQLYSMSLHLLDFPTSLQSFFSSPSNARKLCEMHTYLFHSWTLFLVSQPSFRDCNVRIRWTCSIIYYLTTVYCDFNSAAALLRALFSPMLLERCGQWTMSIPKSLVQWLSAQQKVLWAEGYNTLFDPNITHTEHYISSLHKLIPELKKSGSFQSQKGQRDPFSLEENRLREILQQEGDWPEFVPSIAPTSAPFLHKIPVIIPWALPVVKYLDHLTESYSHVMSCNILPISPEKLASPGAELCHQLFLTLSMCSFSYDESTQATFGVKSNRYLLHGLAMNYIHDLIISHWLLTRPFLPLEDMAKTYCPRVSEEFYNSSSFPSNSQPSESAPPISIDESSKNVGEEKEQPFRDLLTLDEHESPVNGISLKNEAPHSNDGPSIPTITQEVINNIIDMAMDDTAGTENKIVNMIEDKITGILGEDVTEKVKELAKGALSTNHQEQEAGGSDFNSKHLTASTGTPPIIIQRADAGNGYPQLGASQETSGSSFHSCSEIQQDVVESSRISSSGEGNEEDYKDPPHISLTNDEEYLEELEDEPMDDIYEE